MASASMAFSSGLKNSNSNNIGIDKLPEEMNDMKLRDDKVTRLIDYILYENICLNWNTILFYVNMSEHVLDF